MSEIDKIQFQLSQEMHGSIDNQLIQLVCILLRPIILLH